MINFNLNSFDFKPIVFGFDVSELDSNMNWILFENINIWKRVLNLKRTKLLVLVLQQWSQENTKLSYLIGHKFLL